MNSTNYSVGSVFKADGDYILGTDRSTYRVSFRPVDWTQLSGLLYSIPQTGSSRWTPYSIFCLSTDLDTYDIVPGDGFKGYIDTSILRCANGNYGQLYDDGNLLFYQYSFNWVGF